MAENGAHVPQSIESLRVLLKRGFAGEHTAMRSGFALKWPVLLLLTMGFIVSPPLSSHPLPSPAEQTNGVRLSAAQVSPNSDQLPLEVQGKVTGYTLPPDFY